MNKTIYHYQIMDGIPMNAVKDSLLLSVMAAESLYGRPRINLEARFRLERVSRVYIIEAGSKIGETIARVFTGLLIREFGEQAFKVERKETSLEVETTAEELETALRNAHAFLSSDPDCDVNSEPHKHSKGRKHLSVSRQGSDD
ncbi:hypothetical protein HQ587_08670 [bacterium]|nr:hypothetical protein [bacterium]